MVKTIQRHCRLGPFGRAFNNFVPVEPWLRKANRELVTLALSFQPNYLVTFGHYQIHAGALAQIRSSVSVALVHVWPDTLLNVDNNLISCLPLFDLVASYSESSSEQLRRMGAKHVVWIPLAGDPSMHPMVACNESERIRYGADVTFIGGWRPEREAVLSKLKCFKMKIWGPDWGRRCRRNGALLKRWQGRPLYEDEFAKAVTSSTINLNIIDPLNYPAANMRFFELSVAGGLQVCSPCPEMEQDFIHGEHLFYYKDDDELSELVATLVEDETLRNRIREAARAKVLSAHTYLDRARRILQSLESRVH
ncbi:MAG: CgeB family protein [Pyrinomonadaceae bacterium]